MEENQSKVIYSMDSEEKEVLIPYVNKETKSHKEIKEVLYQYCPFSVTGLTYFCETEEGFNIELYDDEDYIYSSEPMNVIHIKL